MLTTDLTITKPEYWAKIYTGQNEDAAQDASNTTRPENPFDRFGWVAQYVEGPNVLDIGSGHAHICKRVKAKHPEWVVIASDQTAEAVKVANYEPYIILNAYDLSKKIKVKINTLICTQALEYLEFQEDFLHEAQLVAEKIILTLPIGEMKKWSQLRIYTEISVRDLLKRFGDIEVFERHGDLLLVKLKFHV